MFTDLAQLSGSHYISIFKVWTWFKSMQLYYNNFCAYYCVIMGLYVLPSIWEVNGRWKIEKNIQEQYLTPTFTDLAKLY